jgi:hypothetical protein
MVIESVSQGERMGTGGIWENVGVRQAARTCILLGMMLLLGTGAAQAGVIQGVVLENATGKPLARASVAIEVVAGGPGPRISTKLTDSRGVFVFEGLGAGSYQISVKRRGFVTARHGQKKYDDPGSPIVVEGDGSFTTEIRMRRAGAIAGSVVDENGVGLADFSVSAYKIGTRARLAGAVQSDERGEFRIHGLGPGRYWVATAGKELEDGTGMLPTYFGQGSLARPARQVEVRLDEVSGDVRIAPAVGKLAVIRGIVSGPGIMEVRLHTELGERVAAVGAGGAFRFPGVAPGRYELSAEAGGSETPVSVWTPVDAAAGEVFVELNAGASPLVALQCRDREGRPARESALSIYWERAGREEESERRLGCGKALQLPAGLWRMRMLPSSDVWVESILEARRPAESGADALELLLSAGERRTLQVGLAPTVARLSGVVKAGDGGVAMGAPVLVRASTEELHQKMGGMRRGRTDGEGRFRFDGLAPGEYYVASGFDLKRADGEEWDGMGGRLVRLEEKGAEEIGLELTVAGSGWQ